MNDFLNMRTIMLGYTLTGSIGTLIMWLVWRKNRSKFPGIGYWFTGYLMHTAGQVLLLFQGYLDNIISVLMANMIILTSVFVIFFGMILFTGVHFKRYSAYVIIFITAGVYYFFTAVNPSLKGRVFIFSSVFILASLHFIYIFFRVERRQRRNYYETGSVFLLFCLVYAARIISFLNGPDSGSFYDSTSTDLILILASQMLFILLTFSFVIVINNRLVSDLNDHAAERENLVKEFKRMASIDALTGIYNRLKLEPILTAEVLRSKRYGRRLSLLLIDIDHFKLVNDRYGHNIGDSVLRDVASILRDNLRDTDQLGRWGGEEFLVVVPETTDEAAKIIAEKLRIAVETRRFIMDISVTISIGVASLQEGEWEEDVIRRADEAMYRAKNSGRNRIA